MSTYMTIGFVPDMDEGICLCLGSQEDCDGVFMDELENGEIYDLYLVKVEKSVRAPEAESQETLGNSGGQSEAYSVCDSQESGC